MQTQEEKAKKMQILFLKSESPSESGKGPKERKPTELLVQGLFPGHTIESGNGLRWVLLRVVNSLGIWHAKTNWRICSLGMSL